MTFFKLTKLVPYKKEKMFFLVNDVENYYKFFPKCIYSRIIKKKK